MPELTGKTAIVTGGATTVGRGVVEALHRDGANVVIADIDEAGGKQVAADFGDRVRFHPTDITDEASAAACVATAESTFGGVDILVNLACSYLDEGFASTRSQWVQALDVNVVSAACFVQAVHASMVDRGGGVIINFTSISSKVAQTGRWVYPVSKAALVQLTRNMAMDLAADGIRVNSVSPGWTWSKIMQSLTGDNRAKTDSVAAPFHLLGRVGDPIEVGNVVSFLCSEQAGFVTGADWAVDGGYSAMGPEQAVPAISQLTV
jgi:NAD(P)-dependent dehydrogenase (short-subunit alcohol dehydrogenase family)